jgi:hypothetical protein
MIDVRALLFTEETEAHLSRASANEIRQLLGNRHVTTDNPRGVNRVGARLALAPPTPPGMRVRTGRFAQRSRKRR